MPVNKDAVALINKVNKELKAEAVVLGSAIKVSKRFTTGSLALDVALGGGWPANQWAEIVGHESSGKTAVALKTVAANQKINPDFTTLWIAAEHYDADQAQALGVDNDRVIVHSTQSMEEAYEVVLTFAESRTVDLIVIDSYPALVADEEAEKGMDEATMALGARLTGKFFRKAGAATRRSLTDEEDRPILGIMINQFRDAIGQFSPFGTPTTSPGGKAKNYAFYVRIETKRDEYIEEPIPGKNLKMKVGQTIKATTVKNKSAAPRQVAKIDFYFRDAPQHGFERGDYDEVQEIKVLGLLYDVIQRSGAYFSVDDGRGYDDKGYPLLRWQGKEALDAAVRGDLDLQEYIKSEVLVRASNPAHFRAISEDDVETASSAGERKVSRRGKGETDAQSAA
jgi:recombination protein RecA